MTWTRGSMSRRGSPVGDRAPVGAAYRNLPPVRLGGGVRRVGLGFGAGPPHRSGRLAGLFGWVLRRRSRVRQLDWVLLAVVLALASLGTILVYAATEPVLAQLGANPKTYLIKQLLNLGIGLTLMVGVSMLDYRQIRRLAPWVMAASLLGLLAVLSPLGTVVNGAKAWISLPGGFQIEPSEYAKISVILIGATLLGELGLGQSRPGPKRIAAAIAVGGVPLLLVVAEPALGVTLVLLALLIGLIVLSGVRLRWLGALAVIGVGGLVAIAKLHLLKSYQVSRLTSFLHPNADPRGTGYSAAQALISVGSGGMHGQGLFHGQLVSGSFVPEQYTDFIFTVAGEELGFIGSLIIIGLLGLLLFRALHIAYRADDQFGTLVAAGIAIWFGVQSFINIGMTIGIMPVTGLPLPFLSYGGSALFADMIAIGILQAVHRHRLIFSGL
jgi:rod shape determining protein RodA